MSRDVRQLDPDVAEKCANHLLACKAAGLDVFVTQTYRTREEQQKLYDQGRKTEGLIVTYSPPGYSWHEWRRAYDLAFLGKDGEATWDGDWGKVGDLGERCGLEWGGRWKTPDRPHFEDTGGLTLSELRAAHPNGLTASDNKA